MKEKNIGNDSCSHFMLSREVGRIVRKVEADFPNLEKALSFVSDRSYLHLLTEGTDAEGQDPADIEIALEVIFVRRFGEKPSPDDRIFVRDIQMELHDEFLIEVNRF